MTFLELLALPGATFAVAVCKSSDLHCLVVTSVILGNPLFGIFIWTLIISLLCNLLGYLANSGSASTVPAAPLAPAAPNHLRHGFGPPVADDEKRS